MRVKVKVTGQVGELVGFNIVMVQAQGIDPKNLSAAALTIGPPQMDAMCLVAIEDKFVLISGGALEPIYDESVMAELKEAACCMKSGAGEPIPCVNVTNVSECAGCDNCDELRRQRAGE